MQRLANIAGGIDWEDQGDVLHQEVKTLLGGADEWGEEREERGLTSTRPTTSSELQEVRVSITLHGFQFKMRQSAIALRAALARRSPCI
jgi:hypothetical protein